MKAKIIEIAYHDGFSRTGYEPLFIGQTGEFIKSYDPEDGYFGGDFIFDTPVVLEGFKPCKRTHFLAVKVEEVK